MEDGVLLIDKSAGMTSFGVVARVRRILSSQAGKKIKVGHTGTLDPFATGLMIIVVGKECKNAQRYSKLDKQYEATITLGATSTTGDPEGEITATVHDAPSREAIEQVLKQLTGEIVQRPPAFSAIKINGRRAYQLARAGAVVELPERPVTIHAMQLISYQYPQLTIRAHVSSGTYIRSLAERIGELLGTGAYCSALRRLTVGEYNIVAAQTLGDLGIKE